ncbi:MAG: GTPase [Gemmatimonadales bacterium]|nr:MAG: GTPase [Gemmatimonadales bacterium]
MASRIRTLILGAAGRDFHNFNMVFREDDGSEVVAFTAQQIPNITNRRYPPALAGPLYPDGIPIHPESELESLIAEFEVERCVMAYSDISHEEVMHLASRVNAARADFALLGTRRTQVRSWLPSVSVVASRTGAGKSQTARAVAAHLRSLGIRVGILRHPMPYGDLEAQAVQRFAHADDLDRHQVTIEEREEYEPHLEAGSIVWAGVDYARIVRAAEAEADVLLWDGGNNDTSFLASQLTICVVDPHRAGDEVRYHPGETNLRVAQVVVVNKVDSAHPEQVFAVRETIRRVRPDTVILEAASPPVPDDPEILRSRRVLALEDGPTLTHGGMPHGAGWLGARRAGAKELVDPRPFAHGALKETFRAYPHISAALPAMGYGEAQIRDLQATLETACREGGVEAVAVGTPIDISRLLDIPVPHTRIRYDLQVLGRPTLEEALAPFVTEVTPVPPRD